MTKAVGRWVESLYLPHRIEYVKSVGFRAACQYLIARKRRPYQKPPTDGVYKTITLTPRLALFPLHMRVGSSDIDVYQQIFVEREYQCVDDIEDARHIIDCGANVGYSSAYFLSRYPNARVIAIEPDESNFALLQRNLAPYGDRAHLIRAGVWSHDANLSVHRSGDGLEWSISVEESRPEEQPDIRAINLSEAFKIFGPVSIDILKVDIEGSERVVFSRGYEQWLPAVRTIVIELHGPDCEAAVDQALQNKPHRKLDPDNELTVYRID